MSEAEPDSTTPLLPSTHPASKRESTRHLTHLLLLACAGLLVCGGVFVAWLHLSRGGPPPFFSHIAQPRGLCAGVNGPSVSHAGHIGLAGDSDADPKRSFFWFFEAENDAASAPIILTVGGGPGVTGLLNPMVASGPCLITANGTVPNPNRWTEHMNLLALDHPIGAGFSYGTHVDNSRKAAFDVYDFLQKFFRLYPQLAKNPLVVSGGSYGGTYVPHIATVIHEQNLLVAQRKGQPGAVHINLESMMLVNPFTVCWIVTPAYAYAHTETLQSARSHFTWLLHYRCHHVKHMYNTTTCDELYTNVLPRCLDAIDYAYQVPHWDIDRRVAASEICGELDQADTHGVLLEDVRRMCEDPTQRPCLGPTFPWLSAFFNEAHVREELDVPASLEFIALAQDVPQAFGLSGDVLQEAHLLYTPLLEAGIRLLHFVGKQDANCAWPGVLSFLKEIQSPYQADFRDAPDVPWPTAEGATVRVIGPGAGSFTYILVEEAGHSVPKDQPALSKRIVEHWIQNIPYV
ncbi:unnamed protein product [Mycena citricolor]|uniref:Alpha/beta-hydrolase n=1 Tax=Mycena citricolor TaxID=2018698 RepID=A0AAD2JZU6_9AGAR|nr:unnamed protein product [Mycena citricolor]